MLRPDETDLLAFFESVPESPDEEHIPFEYKESSYRFEHKNGNTVLFTILPAYDEVAIDLDSEHINLSLRLENVEEIVIVSDKKDNAQINFDSKFSFTTLHLKPEIKLVHKEERDL
ncbi:hypothetical protein [Fusibacter sp. JL216-2]|uniref:hypothetical protein n=1 Tax=Fusibacter sp. JL216-2 TaxID=3071453 RepID=UPI003D328CFF